MHSITGTWVALGIVIGLAGWTGCSGTEGTTGLMGGNGVSAQETQGFSLRLLDDGRGTSSLPGAAWLEVRQQGAGIVAVDLCVSAPAELDALYCAVDYDAGSYTPVSAAASGLLGDAGSVLEMAVLDTPGTAYLGQVSIHPPQAQPAKGSGLAARFMFKAGAVRHCTRLSSGGVPKGNYSELQISNGVEPISPYRDYLKWYYVNPGDFDQNGEVSITDLATLAMHFGKNAANGSFQISSKESVVDGDGNGEINSGDLTVIAQNYGNLVAGFRVYSSADAADYPADGGQPNGEGSVLFMGIALADYEAASAAGRYEYHLVSPGLNGQSCWVRLVGAGGELGSVTNRFDIPALTPPTVSTPGNALVLLGTTLSWYYANPGDYNQSGSVESTDANAVNIFFHQTGPWPVDDVRCMVDGTGNEQIDLGDITYLALHMHKAVAGYHVYASAQPSDYPATASEVSKLAPFASIAFPDTETQAPVGSNTNRLAFSVEVPVELQGLYYWVRPFFSETEGIASGIVGGGS